MHRHGPRRRGQQTIGQSDTLVHTDVGPPNIADDLERSVLIDLLAPGLGDPVEDLI